MKAANLRSLAAQISYAVVFQHVNLSDAFKKRLNKQLTPELISSIKALCFETIRHYLSLEDLWLRCVDKKPKDKLVRVLLTQGMAEFHCLQKPAHAVVNEAINACKILQKKWAAGLINSCLRQAIKLENPLPSDDVAKFAHPQWWLDSLKNDWPQHWQQLLNANNQQPPLWIRSKNIPNNQLSPLAHSHIPNAYKITPQDITQLPEFQHGYFSVQDASAQMAAHILAPQDNEKILDACAAPGGKTCHLLELNTKIRVDAVELYPNRAKKIADNLQRLKLNANIIVADAKQTDTWFRGEKYDKILLDAPCSASGIVRRHADIKFIRQASDLQAICLDQQELLNAVAKIVKTHGTILYATCSVFQAENSHQIKYFLKSHPEFSEIKLKYPCAIDCEYGIQILTGSEDADGFYYCYLRKNETGK